MSEGLDGKALLLACQAGTRSELTLEEYDAVEDYKRECKAMLDSAPAALVAHMPRCSACGYHIVHGQCACGGELERFTRAWQTAMATSSQRLDVAAMEHLINGDDEQAYAELREALRAWIDARRMRRFLDR